MIANRAPIIDNIPGKSFNIISVGDEKLNSASTKLMLLGWINKELPKKSLPIPTNKSENTNPKNILNIAKKNRGIITNKLASCTLL